MRQLSISLKAYEQALQMTEYMRHKKSLCYIFKTPNILLYKNLQI